MSIVDIDVVLLGNLAKISITESERDRRVADIQAILSYVGQIQSVSSDASVATVIPPITAIRDDIVHSFDNNSAIIAQFPDRQTEYLKVPPVFSH